MPFIDDAPAAGLPLLAPAPLDITPPPQPFSRLFDTAMRRDNIVGSITEAATQPPMGAFDASFDPWAKIEGYEDYARSFIGANNDDDVRHVKARIDKERRDEETLTTGGWRGTLAQLAAGGLDPTNMIPAGGQVRAITRGGRALEGLVRGGAAFGAGSILQETGLQASQITRPTSESLLNIGSATVLGGILGGAVGALTRPTMRTLRDLGDSSALGGLVFDRELAANLPGRRNLEEIAEVIDQPAVQRAAAAAGGDAAKVAEDLRLRIDDALSTGGIVEHRNQGGEKVRVDAIDEAGIMTDANGARLTLDDVTGPGHSLEIRTPADTGRGIGPLIDDPLALHLRGDLSAARAAEIRDLLPTLDPAEAARLREAGVPLDQELWKVIASNLEKAEASRPGGLAVIADQLQYLRRGGDLDTTSEREAFAVINRAMQAEVARGGDPARFLDEAIATLPDAARPRRWADDWKSRLLYALPPPAEPGRAGAMPGRPPTAGATTPTAAGGSLSAASPHASLDQETIASALGIERALVRVSPTLRAGTSPSLEVRRTALALADQPLDLKKNVEGIPTAQSVESLIKQFQGPLAEAEIGVDDLFTQYRLGRSRRTLDIAKLEARDMFGAPQGAMSYSEFREAIGRAMRRGDEATQPEVAQAAKLLREKVFDPLKSRAIDAGLMPEDIDTKTAESYLMRVYDSTKIVAQRGQFSDVITRWLGGEQAKKDTIRTRVTSLLGEYELLQSRAVPRVTRIAEIRSELEDLVQSWEGKTSQAAKSALARRGEEEAGRTPEQGRLAGADRAVIAAAEAIANANTRLEEVDLRDIARQIIDRILGSPVGRLPYDMEVPHPSGGPPRPDRAAPRGPLAQRSFMIPDELIEPWLESDSREIARMYTRTMAPDVLLAERFGRTDMEAQLQEIMASYERLRHGKSEAEQTRLHSQMQADLRDIAAMRDRMRGTYALPADPNGLGNRAFHVVRDLNYLRLLGGMTISALPDMGRLVMQHGFSRVFGDAIVPMLRGFQEFRLAANEAKLSGTALDMVLDTRAMSMADMLDDYGRWSKYERGLKGLTDRFGLVTLMAPWNSAMKQIAGVIGQTRTLEAIEALVAGQKLRQAERTRLASLGIGPEMAEKIDAQFKAHGQKQDNGSWWANSQAWTDRDAIEAFRSALNKEIDTTIVTKGQEVPLWMSGGGSLLPGNVGKMIGQFRSFSLASAQRVMMAGLQKRDMATLNGALLMVGLGMMVYAVRNATNPKAQPLPDPSTPGGLARWIREGVDISGLTGYLFDVHNMIEKASGGGVGISRLTGGPAQSRYANRNTLESILGPTAGLVQDAGQLLGAATKGEWSAGDSSRVRRMIPTQNLIGMRHLFDAAEHGLNHSLGVREPPPRR